MNDELLNQKKEIKVGIKNILDKYKTETLSTSVDIREFLKVECFRIDRIPLKEISDSDKKIRVDFSSLKVLETALRQVYDQLNPRRNTLIHYGNDVEFNHIVYGMGLLDNDDDPTNQALELGLDDFGEYPYTLPSQTPISQLTQEQDYAKTFADNLREAGFKPLFKPLPESHTWQYVYKRIISLAGKDNFLTDKQKSIFKLRLFNPNLSFDKIGKRLGITKQTAQEHFEIAVAKILTDSQIARYFRK